MWCRPRLHGSRADVDTLNRDTKADTLAILLRVYNYAAFTAARYPASTCVITGTGLTPPAFDGS